MSTPQPRAVSRRVRVSPVPAHVAARLRVRVAIMVRALGLDMGDVVGLGRHRDITLARAVIVYVLRSDKVARWGGDIPSYPEIASAMRMAGTSHTSCIEWMRRAERLIDDEKFRAWVDVARRASREWESLEAGVGGCGGVCRNAERGRRCS